MKQLNLLLIVLATSLLSAQDMPQNTIFYYTEQVYEFADIKHKSEDEFRFNNIQPTYAIVQDLYQDPNTIKIQQGPVTYIYKIYQDGIFYLHNILYKSDFLKSQQLLFSIKGKVPLIKNSAKSNQPIIYNYKAISTFGANEMRQMDGYAQSTADSLQLEIIGSVSEALLMEYDADIMGVRYPCRQMDIVHKSQIYMFRKLHGQPNFIPFTLDRATALKDPLFHLSDQFKLLHEYYTPSHFLPILSYRRGNAQIHDVTLIDPLNVQDVNVFRAKDQIVVMNAKAQQLRLLLPYEDIGYFRAEWIDMLGKIRASETTLSNHNSILELKSPTLPDGIYQLSLTNGRNQKLSVIIFLKIGEKLHYFR